MLVLYYGTKSGVPVALVSPTTTYVLPYTITSYKQMYGAKYVACDNYNYVSTRLCNTYIENLIRGTCNEAIVLFKFNKPVAIACDAKTLSDYYNLNDYVIVTATVKYL